MKKKDAVKFLEQNIEYHNRQIDHASRKGAKGCLDQKVKNMKIRLLRDALEMYEYLKAYLEGRGEEMMESHARKEMDGMIEECCVCGGVIEGQHDLDDCDGCGEFFHLHLCGHHTAINHLCNNCSPISEKSQNETDEDA